MLIRTQNKLSIVNLECSDSIVIEKIWETKTERAITAYNCNATTRLGTYATEQRAIEVLDEICNTYIVLNCIDRKTGIAVVKNGIYQMPEE